MTNLGILLSKKSISKAEFSRKTGINKSRLSEFTINKKTKLRAEELYLIALAINVNPCEQLDFIYGKMKLKI